MYLFDVQFFFQFSLQIILLFVVYAFSSTKEVVAFIFVLTCFAV